MSFRSALSNLNFNLMKVHKSALTLSVFAVIISVFFLFSKGLNVGIDFSGGILMEVKIESEVDISDLRDVIAKDAYDVQIQNIDGENLLIRVGQSGDNQSDTVKKIQDLLSSKFSSIEYRKIDYVGPQIGSELVFDGILALFFSFFLIMFYIWIRFDWQFGIGGILALFHDAILTLGFYSISGLEFNITSIAAILTIIGYSINDSVVIYDRVRENLRKHKSMDMAQLLNASVNSTFSRTILTSGVTLFSLLALMIFGGDVLFSFSAATFFGILIGTYSSIYISVPVLLYIDPRQEK